jgi:DNA-binding NtrC family response regulator
MHPKGHMTGVVTHTGKIQTKPHEGVALRVPDKTQILIVSDNEPDTDQLKGVFQHAGLSSESANNIAAGCESAKTGRFGVVFSTPSPGGGSWRRLIEVASHNGLGFEIVVLARSFDLNQWGEAMQLGAFDVLDVVRDLPNASEVARRALGSAHLKRFRSRPLSAGL